MCASMPKVYENLLNTFVANFFWDKIKSDGTKKLIWPLKEPSGNTQFIFIFVDSQPARFHLILKNKPPIFL